VRSRHETLKAKITGLACVFSACLLLAPRGVDAAEIEWKGYTWSVTNGGMAGVAAGDPANVSVDASGYLHLAVRKKGDAWTAAELFTTTRLGFGTYQWQLDGPIDTFDKNVVLGLFPYGPAAGIGSDGTNEIDIEYSRWGQDSGPNGDWTNYPASGATVGELSYEFSLAGGTLSTSRFIWTPSSIEDFLFGGLEPLSSSQSLIKSWKYSPSNAKTNIPQQSLPLGMNLWCFDIPSDGKNVEIVVRDFQFVPEGASSGGGGGSGGSGASTSTAGRGSSGDTSMGGRGSSGDTSMGGQGAGGDSSIAGAPAMGGALSHGGSGADISLAGAGSGGPSGAGGPGASEHAGTAAGNSTGSRGSGCSFSRSTPARGGHPGWIALLGLLGLLLTRARRRKRQPSVVARLAAPAAQ
jgi:MYXO-CTERM domain-containing protein